ncbi:hypothetical protein SALWKB12_0147 [Snodgrassella communis]|uniref:Uncharacterized protein n=1 Tax=Snodgrassella communis TaxID=2946699 RepID=A0A836MST7_9NEIS|nr:hypothetical protein SALWKB12_0147 [Snodgrassella communis]KDN15597.1 hypothetical protein SALWKB29_0016 [Snodgrassella communis]
MVNIRHGHIIRFGMLFVGKEKIYVAAKMGNWQLEDEWQ